MKINRAHAFAAGVVVALLMAAAKFVGGTPLDQTFTYQGQLRNAGQLVNVPVDLRITLWDADVAGGQIGSANTFNAMQLNEGRFACGLNFGNAAFDGSNRWIQVEFRNPAGVGQYQSLSPRDKITATPYALYALNGANGVWVYDTNQQSVSVMGKKVGIGTSNPTAALEVVDARGGDDSVKLPAESIGLAELSPQASTFAFGFTANAGVPFSRTFETFGPCVAVISVSGVGLPYDGYHWTLTIDGGQVPLVNSGWSCSSCTDDRRYWGGSRVIQLPAGSHVLTAQGQSGELQVSVVIVNSYLP